VRTDVCKVLVGKCKRKRQFGKVRCKWDLNIKRDIMEIYWRAWTASICVCVRIRFVRYI
jgi:hypothetical protein